MNAKFYIEIAIIVLAVIFFGFYLAWQIKKKGLKQIAVSLIVYAEENFKFNDDKFDYCVNQLIKLIPAPFNFFVTDKMVEELVQNVFNFIKKSLDYVPKKEV